MKLGLNIPDFTWPGGPAKLGATLAQIARTADQAGFQSISVMDHFWQIGRNGPPEHDMLEGYTTLAFMAGLTSRVTLGTMVTGAVYRYPGVLAKTVTALDVLSGGRAWLGIGAAWNEAESRGLGIPFPPIAERFERLEETLQIPHKLEVLREHCQAVGRNYDEIEKTAVFGFDTGDKGEKVGQLIGGLRWLAGMGIQTVFGNVPRVYELKGLEIMGEKVIPAVAVLEHASEAR